jgi:hypothetical protein
VKGNVATQGRRYLRRKKEGKEREGEDEKRMK